MTNTKSATNRALFENDRITELYKQAVETTDEAARIAMYKEIQEIMHDYCVYWPWFYERLLDCYADGVEGVKAAVLQAVKEAGPNACPPMVVGVGIGGNIEKSAELAKHALTRPLTAKAQNEAMDALEAEILEPENGEQPSDP